jgi:hypothetical protein
MIEASPSPRGVKAARLPHFAVPDRAHAARPVPQDRVAGAAAQAHAPADVQVVGAQLVEGPVVEVQVVETQVPAGYDPVDYSGTAFDDALGAGSRPSVYERGGFAGTPAPTPPAIARDGADLDDLSNSLGDGARRAVDVAAARWDNARARRDAAAAQAAKLRLQQALNGVRRVCVQAMRQRMHTEMADLAGQIRRMHDGDVPPR